MKSQFYLTLPSNSSTGYYPENTVSNYITHLSRAISLEGEWEVAVVEVHYPCSLLTLSENSTIIIYAYPKDQYEQLKSEARESGVEPNYDSILPTMEVATLTPGDYIDVQEVVSMINKHDVVKEYAYFNYEEKTKRNEINCRSHVIQIELSDKLALQLGYSPGENDLKKNNLSIRPANLRVGLPSQMYIYCDIVEPQLVGDYMAPLLQMINIDTTNYVYGGSRFMQFHSPHYIPVLKASFESVEIDLRDNTGVKLPFKFGTSCVKLHFKRKENDA